MSCHSCAASFGFLKKELGCPLCGFSYCSKCLKYEVKGLKSTVRVCRSCSQKQESVSGNQSSKSKEENSRIAPDMDIKPPDVYIRHHLETLEDPSRPPVTVYTQKPNAALQSFQAKNETSVPSEQELRGRLQKLRQRLTTAPSVEEMEERLARLQGMPMKLRSQSVDVSAVPVSSEEQTRNLMQQLKEESSLPRQNKTAWHNEIEARLAKLKGIDPEKMDVGSETAVENMDTEPSDAEGLMRQLAVKDSAAEPSDADGLLQQMAAKGGEDPVADEESELAIVNRILAEVDLEEKLGDDADSDDEVISETVEEELPWCCICNADASLRCPGCAGDLYCSRCFKEGHNVCDMEDHKPVAYQPKCPV